MFLRLKNSFFGFLGTSVIFSSVLAMEVKTLVILSAQSVAEEKIE
jgi:hypothetical protein